MVYEFIIVGAGISGIAFGRLLRQAGLKNFVILEALDRPGGLCRSERIGPYILDIGGGHFFYSKFPEVYRFVFSRLPKEKFNWFRRISRISLDGVEVDYPLESNIWQLPGAMREEFLKGVLEGGEARGEEPPRNFDAWIRWKLGERVAESYMVPYNKKIWGVDPSEMDVDWLEKVPRLNVDEIVRSCREGCAPPGKMPSHEYFFYPKEGGFQAIVDAIAGPVLPHIRFNERVRSIKPEGPLLVVNGSWKARRVINTAPWPTLLKGGSFPQEISRLIERLSASSIVVSLHAGRYSTDAHWLYEPDLEVSHHRTFFIRNFTPESSQYGFFRETNLKRWKRAPDALFAHTNLYGYPIPLIGKGETIRRILDWCRQRNIYGLGRWGQWQYFNSDVCIKEAMKLARSLGIPVPEEGKN